MEPNSIDYQDTINALKIVSDAADHVNKLMTKSENFRSLIRLELRFGGNIQIIQPDRTLIKEGSIMKVGLRVSIFHISWCFTNIIF